MTFSPVWADKSNGQTITAPELNQLKNQQVDAVDKTGDTVPGLITFDLNIGYTTRTVDRERIVWTSAIDSITLLPHFGRTVADLTADTIRQFSLVSNNFMRGDLIALPHASTVTEISCNFTPIGGHANLPSTQPSFRLRKRARLGGIASTVILASNIKADVVDYNAASILAVETGAEVIDLNGFTYWLEFLGESGPNSLAGLIFQGASIKLDIDEQDVA